MCKKRWIIMASLLSFSALAEVSFEEKRNRVEFLEELTQSAVSMDIEAYRRELNYEQRGLSLDERAENETNILANEVKRIVIKAYEASINSHGDENQAVNEIRTQIEKDLELVEPSLKEELRKLALDTLESIQRGGINTEVKLDNIQKTLMKGVKERSAFLNEEVASSLPSRFKGLPKGVLEQTRSSYNSKSDILASLVSEFESAPYTSTSTTTLKSDVVSTRAGLISLQVKVEFLGSSISAGPQIGFKREFKTLVDISAEGLNPVLLHDGNFDFYKRDTLNRVIKLNGQSQKRRINFNCDASLAFETDYIGGGGFSVAGMGASGTISKRYSNSVTLSSRRIAVPEYIDGKTTTYRTLIELCHTSFLKTKISNYMTVESSLNVMMKNVVSSIKFSHPKTKCVADYHCFNWYNREVLPLFRGNNYPRCVEESREKYYSCQLRGLKGQNCALFNKSGKRLTNGMGEFICDRGLRCTQIQAAGIFQAAKGRCLPINPKTYRSPLEKDYIEVYLQ